MTFLFKTWHVMCRTWLSCSEHDCHVLNMSVMFWTWASCLEHDCHVQNTTVMFWTWYSCSEHDSHVSACSVMFRNMKTMFWNIKIMFRIFMFRMIWTGSEHAEHDQTWIEHKWRLLNTIWTWNFECHVQNMFSSSKHALNMLNMLNMTRHVRTWSGTWRNMGGKS